MADREAIVDSHIHFWDPERLNYPWLEEHAALRRRFIPADLAATGARVDGVVFVQADCIDEQSMDEVAWVERLSGEGAPIRGIVAHAPLELGEQARGYMTGLAGRPRLVGVRHLLQDEPPGFALRPDFVDGVRVAGEHGLTFDLCIRHHQMAEVTALVARCPETRFVLDHLGKPHVGATMPRRWQEELAVLAARPNVYCKLSGLATEVAQPTLDLGVFRPYLRHALQVFGPRRCMFGSDWPVAITAISYTGWLDVVREAIGDLPAHERDAVLRATALDAYGLVAEVRTGGSEC